MEELVIPGLGASAVRLSLCKVLHIGKIHANKPWGLPSPEGHRLHEAFFLTHDELAGDPLYTLNIQVVPCQIGRAHV